MRRRGFRLVDIVVLTAPFLAAGLYLVISAASGYYHAIQFDDWWSRRANVNQFFLDRLHALEHLPTAIAVDRRLNPAMKDAAAIKLHLAPSVWDKMWEDPQLGWGQWVNGSLEEGGDLLSVKVRKRGDNSVHWTTEKHTITVKTPRTEFFKRYRVFGLSVKDVLPSYLANRMAKEFGLLAPTTTVVPVFINNRYNGMYRFIETVDESFLRPYDRLPGNIFRGDAAERSDYFKGLPRDLFANPYIWDRVAVSDRPTGPGSGQLRLFLEDINGTTFEDHQRLMRRMDRDELARLMAYFLLAGDPYHADAVHNQFWYEDPSTSLLHPIPWDTRLLELRRQDQRVSPILRVALQDPFLVDEVMQEVRRALDERKVESVADSLTRTAYERYRDEFEYDQLRSGLVPDVGSVEEVTAKFAGNVRLLREWSAEARTAFHSGAAAGVTVLDFETRGYVGSDLVALNLTGARSAPVLRMDRNLNGALDASDPVVPTTWKPTATGGGLALRLAEPLLPGWQTETPGIHPGRVHYRFFLTGTSSGAVLPELTNRVTGQPAALVEWPAGEAVVATTSWNPWQYPVPRGRVIRLQGTVRLTETLRIPAEDTLVIEPGSTLRLAPDVSIISRGLILARGTAAHPINVIPDEAGVPWGAFATQGSGADGTRVSYTRFYFGGGALVDRVEYSGMVNLHWTRHARFSHDTFEENVRSDDAFHATHSDFTVDSSHFLRSNSDALDIDISTANVFDNLFEDTGGDAFDLMTTTPIISGNHIIGSGDKGISIGEASRPFIFNNIIERCERGIEVKDRSAPIVLNNVIRGNKIGIYQRRKNWRYGGGGWATVINTVVEDNGIDLKSDAYSRITVAGDVGLDSVVGAGAERLVHSTPTAARYPWLYASYGIPESADTAAIFPGLLPGAPVPPLVDKSFSDDFGEYTDGWVGTGGVTRLEKHDLALVMSLEQKPGAISLPIDWDLTRPGQRHTAVFELATRDIDRAEVTLVSDGGQVTSPIAPTFDVGLFHLVAVELPPAHYTEIRISAVPAPRVEKLQRRIGWVSLKPGVLHLRGYRLYAVPESVLASRSSLTSR